MHEEKYTGIAHIKAPTVLQFSKQGWVKRNAAGVLPKVQIFFGKMGLTFAMLHPAENQTDSASTDAYTSRENHVKSAICFWTKPVQTVCMISERRKQEKKACRKVGKVCVDMARRLENQPCH
jgi:hypothetical protein